MTCNDHLITLPATKKHIWEAIEIRLEYLHHCLVWGLFLVSSGYFDILILQIGFSDCKFTSYEGIRHMHNCTRIPKQDDLNLIIGKMDNTKNKTCFCEKKRSILSHNSAVFCPLTNDFWLIWILINSINAKTECAIEPDS